MADTSVLGIFTDNRQVRDLIGRYLTSSKISEIPIGNLTSTAGMEIFVLVKLEKMNDDCNFLLTRVTKIILFELHLTGLKFMNLLSAVRARILVQHVVVLQQDHSGLQVISVARFWDSPSLSAPDFVDTGQVKRSALVSSGQTVYIAFVPSKHETLTQCCCNVGPAS